LPKAKWQYLKRMMKMWGLIGIKTEWEIERERETERDRDREKDKERIPLIKS